MTEEEIRITELGESAKRASFPARVFCGVTAAGVLVGMMACAAGDWFYLLYGDASPTGLRMWDGQVDQFLLPVCAVIGAIFGGLLGVAMAIVGDNQVRKRDRR